MLKSTLLLFSCCALLSACEGTVFEHSFLDLRDFGTETTSSASAEKSPAKEEDFAKLIGTAPVGETITVASDTAEKAAETAEAPASKDAGPRLAVLEEYDSATGERCRRFAWFKTDTEQGKIETACRLSKGEDWVTLRPLSHETLSPLASLPPSNVAFATPAPVDAVLIVK